MSKIGTYPLQAIIEQIKTNQERSIILDAIYENVLTLSLDSYGSHVIEKILTCFDQTYIEFIYNTLIENFMLLANHNNGLCVIKKIIINATQNETIKNIQNILIENCLYLIQNPYGNYTIQIAFDVFIL